MTDATDGFEESRAIGARLGRWRAGQSPPVSSRISRCIWNETFSTDTGVGIAPIIAERQGGFSMSQKNSSSLASSRRTPRNGKAADPARAWQQGAGASHCGADALS
jgi:hypothetical protein